MNNIIKKTFAILVITMFIAISVVMPVPRARAWGAVIDVTNLGEQLARASLDIGHWVKEDLMATLRDMVVKTLVNEMTNKIVDSINGNGNPKYITNWKSYLGQAGNNAFNDMNNYLKKLDGINLCAPFYPLIQNNFRSRINSPYGSLPLPNSSCTFSAFKSNLKNSNHYIEKGGWSAYNQLFVPSNNYWMSEELTEDQYQRDLAARSEARKSEAVANSGFLSIKKCVERAPSWTSNTGKKLKGECTKWETVTPGAAVADYMSTAINSNAWYMTNVKSIISAITNSLMSKILSSSGLPGSGSGSIGETYSINKGSSVGKSIARTNGSSLNYIRNGYTDFRNYAIKIKSQIDGSLAKISGLTSCTTGFVSNHITFNYNDSSISCIATSAVGGLSISYNILSSDNYTISKKTSSVDVLKADLISESSYLNNAIIGATAGLSAVNGIDLNSTNVQFEISTAYTNYNNFIAQYKDISSDVKYTNAGLRGKLLVKYSSIYSALSAYSCASSNECQNSGSNSIGS